MNEVMLVPSSSEMDTYAVMAKSACESKMYKGVGDQAGLMAVMLSARELGIAPMTALNGGLNIINGKVEISARMMASMIRRAGHSLQIVRSDASECVLTGQRCDNGDKMTVSFTLEEARLAGLVKESGGWKKWPADMCYARCLSRLARRLWADVISTAYVEGEISGGQFEPVEQFVPPPPVDPEDVWNGFKSVVPEEDQPMLQKYIGLACSKLGIDIEHFVEMFDRNREESLQKFQTWLAKQRETNAS